MEPPAPRVKILFEVCGRCGDEIVNDNRGTGRPWLHLAGEPADGHFPHHGVFLPREQIVAMALAARQEEADQPVAKAERPAPEVPARPAMEEEIGSSNRLGRRQLINLARKEGFTLDIRFARGPVSDQWGKAWRQADSLGVLGIHDDGRTFHAWWLEDNKEGLLFVNARCVGRIGFQNSIELKDYLRRGV